MRYSVPAAVSRRHLGRRRETMPRLLTVLGLALSASLFAPADAQILAAADMRPAQSLDGAWHWSVDPYRDGMAGFHGGLPGESSRRWADIVEAQVADQNPAALFEFDMQRSPVTHLPGSWIGH